MDELNKGKSRTRRRVQAALAEHVQACHGTPQHAAAEGYMDTANDLAAGVGKGSAGNPVNVPDYASRRASQSLAAGHAARSTGDHGEGVGRRQGLAEGHQDLRQSNPNLKPFSRLNPEQTTGFMAVAALSEAQRQGAMLQTQEPRDVNLDQLRARGSAPAAHFRAEPGSSPQRDVQHLAPTGRIVSAPTDANDLRNATSAPRQSMKGSTAFEVMKQVIHDQLAGGDGY